MIRRAFAVIFTTLGAAVFIAIVGLAALYVLGGREPAVPSSATLVLRVGGDLKEVEPGDFVGYLRRTRQPTVRSIVENLRKAKVDARIAAILLKPTGFEAPYWGKVQEIRDAIVDYKRSGKPIYAYLEYGGDREYYLATSCDRIFLMPSSPLDVNGISTSELFLRGALDKVGVFPDLHHIGDYKTATNTFTEKGYTAAHKRMDEALSRDLYDQLVRGIAEGRKKTDEAVRTLLDQGPFLPEDAVRTGLVDDIAYEDQADEKLRGARHGGAEAPARRIDGGEYARISPSSLGLNKGPRIAVIYAAGPIASGKSGYDPVNGSVLGADTLIEYIRQARHDNAVRAIVLRIDSPGGSAAASDAIWRELMIARQERADRPLIASMSDLGASGGYYIAMPAQVIVAQPLTLTGSIGIWGGKFVTLGLFQKLGAAVESTSIGRNAGMDSSARPYSADERRKVQEQLQSVYDQFVEKAARSRHSTPEKIDALAQGRVWTGRQAKENGLVDVLGGLEGAIAVAKQRAKLPADGEVELSVYPPRKNFFEMLGEQFGGAGGDQAIAGAWLSAHLTRSEIEALRVMRGPLTIFRRGEPLALMPFTFVR